MDPVLHSPITGPSGKRETVLLSRDTERQSGLCSAHTDILTALGTKGDAEDLTDDDLTFVNTDTDS